MRILVFVLLVYPVVVLPVASGENNREDVSAAEGIPAEAPDRQIPETIFVAKTEMSGFSPPAGSFDLLEGKLEHVLDRVGNFAISKDESRADTVLRSSLLSWELRQDPTFGYAVEMEISLAMEGKSSDKIIVPSIGIGSTAHAAAVRAVDEATLQYLYHLQTTELRQPDIRIIDMVAGKPILNRGREHGFRRGMEFRNSRDPENPVFLRLQEVYETYSEAYLFTGRDSILIGTPMEKIGRLGLKTSVSMRYVHFLYGVQDEPAADAVSRTWSVGTRFYFDRGLFALNPLVGVDYLGEGTTIAAMGMALNWYSHRIMYVPAAGIQVGLAGSGESGLLWGGFVEFGIRRMLTRSLMLKADLGASSLYFTGDAEGDMQFLYTGLGLILKY